MLQLRANVMPLRSAWADAMRFLAILRRFRAYVRPQLRSILLAAAASVGYTIATLLEPWPLQVIFDGILLQRPLRIFGWDLATLGADGRVVLLGGAAAAVLVLALLRGQFYFIQNVRAATAGQDVVMGIRRALFNHLQTLSLSFHRRAQAGDLLMRLTGDIVMLREMVVAALITLLTQGLVIVGMLVGMLALNVRLTLIAVLIVPLLFLILSSFRLRLSVAAQQQRKREGRLASSMHEVLTSIQVVQANTAEKYEDERFKQMNRRSLGAGVRLTRLEAQMNRSVQVAIALGICLVLWLGSRDVLAGRLSPGELLVFLAYLRSLYRPLQQTAKMTLRMAKASACGDRVLEVLDEKPAIQNPAGGRVLREVRGWISFRGVSFAYRADTPVLQEIDLEARPGELIALVGPTGAGKTTLLHLIPRFYDPTAGELRIEGIPVQEIGLRSLRRQIGFLPQDAATMGLSIRENISYGAIGRKGSAPSDAEIEAVARAARAHEFILRLPRGYDTVIGERGGTLSGGQRQRLAIARALMRNAPILLLDEPTTGLDPIAEEAVLAGLAELTRGRTTLVIAHHLSTILRADRIVFLREGRIVEEGPHRALLAQGGAYAEFFQSEWGRIAKHA
ncbi:ABC transporter ATP-binding protein [bacterium]|nr:ABC transporter ATP-binding protein [bacterium]